MTRKILSNKFQRFSSQPKTKTSIKSRDFFHPSAKCHQLTICMEVSRFPIVHQSTIKSRFFFLSLFSCETINSCEYTHVWMRGELRATKNKISFWQSNSIQHFYYFRVGLQFYRFYFLKRTIKCNF